jgi:hypothetical protein
MHNGDAEAFFSMLDDVWGFYPNAKSPTDGQKAIFFRALREYSLAAVRQAFDSHMRDPQRGRFAPVPADIVAQIEGDRADDGRPGPEEAWAVASAARDENQTIVWTPETAQAWDQARILVANGDDVGARMAFKEVYQRLVAEARAAGRKLTWEASLGHDIKQRDEALAKAHAFRQLPAPQKYVELMAPDHALSASNSRMPEGVRIKLARLREKLVAKQQDDEDKPPQFGPGKVVPLPASAKEDE